jgi:transcriptional regulator of met regulon
MRRLITTAGAVTIAQMDGYFIEERLLDRIMIQISDKGDENLEIAFHERDQRDLSQFTAAQQTQWLYEAMLHVEAGCPLETLDGRSAWVTNEAPSKPRSSIEVQSGPDPASTA